MGWVLSKHRYKTTCKYSGGRDNVGGSGIVAWMNGFYADRQPIVKKPTNHRPLHGHKEEEGKIVPSVD